MMARAITLAKRGQGRVEPNPMVGCVIVRGGRIIGEGYHRRFGKAHAEVEALRDCSENPRGATIYVSLEPCCHTGKTPPCTTALIEAGIGKVVIGTRDPSPEVNGKGIRRLRAAGITVQTGALADEARELIAPFTTRSTLGRPFVIAKWAQSLDGRLGTSTGDSRWISCEASRHRVHQLRARVDAVVVGSGTVLTDNPRLTARGVSLRRRATRVVVDSRLRIPPECELVTTSENVPTLVVTTSQKAATKKSKTMRNAGVEIVACRARGGRVLLGDVLRKMAGREMTNVLVEGGPMFLGSLLEAGLVDEAFVFIAPILLGGVGSAGTLRNLGVRRVVDAARPRRVTTIKSGDDTLCHLRMT
jgi:diaminohydroxyphosphoribosylaminopyrimidine deaminase/5-amino-6-(5-phosphoribosylamino)uracil reductase